MPISGFFGFVLFCFSFFGVTFLWISSFLQWFKLHLKKKLKVSKQIKHYLWSVLWWLRCCAECLQAVSVFGSSYLLMCVLEGIRWWFKYLSLHSHVENWIEFQAPGYSLAQSWMNIKKVSLSLPCHIKTQRKYILCIQCDSLFFFLKKNFIFGWPLNTI